MKGRQRLTLIAFERNRLPCVTRVRDHSPVPCSSSVNAAHAQALVGRHERVYEIIGKPLDLDVVVQAVKETLRARPTK